MIRRLFAVIGKEMRHILRDPRTLGVLFLMPVMMVLLYGYALNMDIEDIPIAVEDRDHTPESRALIRAFTGSGYFRIAGESSTRAEIERHFRVRTARAALVIPTGYERDLKIGPKAVVQIIIDGSDPTYGNAVLNYSNAIVSDILMKTAITASILPADVRSRFLYNPDLKSSHFIIPGLVAVILMMVCALLTSITLSREKETGTMDILVVSPVRPWEIVIGKVIPYVGLSLVDSVFILSFAKLTFNIPLEGDLVLLLGMTVIYIYCALGIGLFISSVAKTQQVAMMAALVATIMPSILLSGFIFPTFSMPGPIRAITVIVPAKHYLEIIRGILLKSSTFDVLRMQAAYLILLGTLFSFLASVRFKTRVR